MQINDIHFKYIWTGGRALILTSVAHLRKNAELKVVGVLEPEDLEWGRGKCASLYTAGEQRLRWIGGVLRCFSRYYNFTHISLRACMY